MKGKISWKYDRNNPLYWERDLTVAVFVQAVRDCVHLPPTNVHAITAYEFLTDDEPWKFIRASQRCKDAVRGVLPPGHLFGKAKPQTFQKQLMEE